MNAYEQWGMCDKTDRHLAQSETADLERGVRFIRNRL